MPRILPLLVVVCSAQLAAAQPIESFTEPFRKLDFIPAESGIIRTLTVREGDHVVKDQQLGALDCEVQEIALRIARLNMEGRGPLQSAVAERDMRHTRLERLQELREAGHATQEELDRATADLAVAEANVQTALEKQKVDELEYERIAAMIERRLLKSPLDGVVTRVYKEQADYVGSSGGPVITIMQLDPLSITFSIPNAAAQSLKQEQSVTLSLPESDQTTRGIVEFVSPVSDAESGTVRVKVLLKNPQGKFRCGVRCLIDLDAAPSR